MKLAWLNKMYSYDISSKVHRPEHLSGAFPICGNRKRRCALSHLVSSFALEYVNPLEMSRKTWRVNSTRQFMIYADVNLLDEIKYQK